MGNGISKDAAEATHWLRKAASGGDEAARGDLLRLVLNGQLDADDQMAVIDMLRTAAEASDPGAEYDLGLCLAHGIGVNQDDEAALTWIRRSAEGGNPAATRMLAQLTADA
jgi:hypothetical protein